MDENKSHSNTAKIRKEAANFLNIIKKGRKRVTNVTL